MEIQDINVGDVVEVTRKDGRKFESFVVRKYPSHKLFCGRVEDKSIPSTSWNRYGLEKNCVCQPLDECSSLKVLRKGRKVAIEDLNSTEVYRNDLNGKLLTLCLSEGFGGWSDKESESQSLFESYAGTARSQMKEEVQM